MGETVVDVPLTAPTPLSMLRLVAPVTDHDSVDDEPGAMVGGEAEKEEMTGFASGVTVTVVVAVTEPASLVAVSV